MREITITSTRGPESLNIRERQTPRPGPGEIRIKVKAIGVNFADIACTLGIYYGAPPLPFVPGYEASGIVEERGPGVQSPKEGDRVIVLTNLGAYSDTLIVATQGALPIPQDKSFEEAAGLAVTYLTAYHGLIYLANLKSGERLLIHSAAGGVGTAAIQLAKAWGAEVFATASASKHEFLRSIGVRHVMGYNDFETQVMKITDGKGVHVVMDPIGGNNFKKSYRSLAPTGRLVCYGFAISAQSSRLSSTIHFVKDFLRTPRFSPIGLMLENKGVFGVHLGRLILEKELLTSHMKKLLDFWSQGVIKPSIGKVFAFEKVREAHRFVASRQSTGKIILAI